MPDHVELTEAELHEAFHYVNASDPGAVGAGKFWLDTSGAIYQMKVRNGADNGWIGIGVVGSGVARSGSTTGNNMAVWNGGDADSIKDGGAVPVSVLPDQVVVPYMYPSAINGSYTRSPQNIFYDYLSMQTGNNSADYFEYPVLLRAGTWNLDMIAVRNSNCGIATITIDGVSVGTLDWYGGADYKLLQTLSGISIATAGVKTVRFASATKNGSSSGYYLEISGIVFTRTG